MKTRKLVIIGIFVLLMIATAVVWTVTFSNGIAENKAEVERTGIDRGIYLLDLQIIMAALTVVFELGIMFNVLYFTSDSSKHTTKKTALSIIDTVACASYTLVLMWGYELFGISSSFIYEVNFFSRVAWWLSFAAIILAPIVAVVVRIIYIITVCVDRRKQSIISKEIDTQ